MLTIEKLKQLQADMPDVDLIIKAEHHISELARTGGKSHTMCVPPKITDTDMILSELVRRYKLCVLNTTRNQQQDAFEERRDEAMNEIGHDLP